MVHERAKQSGDLCNGIDVNAVSPHQPNAGQMA
jgi:hypothetical protein